ncbi:MAG: hypothetical protein ACT4OD_02430 [Candidatus Nitrosotenuis sp.]
MTKHAHRTTHDASDENIASDDELSYLANEIKQQSENLLQNKTKYELGKINSKYVTVDTVQNLLSVLEEECEKMKDKLLYQELIIQYTKDKIAKKRQQINNVKVELKTTRPEVSDQLLILKEELRRTGITDTAKIFQLLKQIASNLNA